MVRGVRPPGLVLVVYVGLEGGDAWGEGKGKGKVKILSEKKKKGRRRGRKKNPRLLKKKVRNFSYPSQDPSAASAARP